jgi:hypothetical protein
VTSILPRRDLVVLVEAVQPCWLSDCDGDPGRTCDPASAKRFRSRGQAGSALAAAQVKYPARTYRIDTLPSLQG